MNRPVFGPDRQTLGSINVTRLLDRLTQPDSLEQELEAIRQRERNDEIFTRAIRKCWSQGMSDPLHGWREEK